MKKNVFIFLIFIPFYCIYFPRISVDLKVKDYTAYTDLVDEFVNSVRLNLADNGVDFSPPYTDVVLFNFSDSDNSIYIEILLNGKTFFFKSFSEEEYRSVSYSSFLNIMESLALNCISRISPGEELRLTYYDAVCEYPYINQNRFYFTSDRLTGNTNVFFRNLDDLKLGTLEIPMSAEVFPVESKGEIYFLKTAVSESEICHTVSGSQSEGTYSEVILKGNISCLREYGGNIFASVWDSIFVFEKSDRTWTKIFNTEENKRIQSFDATENKLIVSVLKENQYDLLAYDLQKKERRWLTDTPYNEMDVKLSSDAARIAFASNKYGNFDIFLKNLGTGTEVRLTKKDSDDFYPCFIGKTDSMIFCRYEKNSEPFLVATAFR